MGLLLLLAGCASNPVVNMLGDRYIFSVKYIDESRYEIQKEGLEAVPPIKDGGR